MMALKDLILSCYYSLNIIPWNIKSKFQLNYTTAVPPVNQNSFSSEKDRILVTTHEVTIVLSTASKFPEEQNFYIVASFDMSILSVL